MLKTIVVNRFVQGVKTKASRAGIIPSSYDYYCRKFGALILSVTFSVLGNTIEKVNK